MAAIRLSKFDEKKFTRMFNNRRGIGAFKKARSEQKAVIYTDCEQPVPVKVADMISARVIIKSVNVDQSSVKAPFATLNLGGEASREGGEKIDLNGKTVTMSWQELSKLEGQLGQMKEHDASLVKTTGSWFAHQLWQSWLEAAIIKNVEPRDFTGQYAGHNWSVVCDAGIKISVAQMEANKTTNAPTPAN
jgi:hypothetical protein